MGQEISGLGGGNGRHGVGPIVVDQGPGLPWWLPLVLTGSVAGFTFTTVLLARMVFAFAFAGDPPQAEPAPLPVAGRFTATKLDLYIRWDTTFYLLRDRETGAEFLACDAAGRVEVSPITRDRTVGGVPAELRHLLGVDDDDSNGREAFTERGQVHPARDGDRPGDSTDR